MADDLDEFLKQAALRRQQRQQQRGTKEPMVQAKPQASAPPPRLKPQEPIPNAVLVENNKPYEPTIGNLSTSLPSSSLPTIGTPSDPRNPPQQKEEFQHELGNLRPAETKPSNKKKNKKEQSQPRLEETPAAPAEVLPTAKVSSASLIAQLRDPQSLRMAIIAHEILKRPWQ